TNCIFFFQAEDGIRDFHVTGVQTCALPILPSLESVLGRLERFLNLPSPCSNNTKERERIVRERLTSKRTLLGLDNFETLNYALRSEERRVGKGCRTGWSEDHEQSNERHKRR